MAFWMARLNRCLSFRTEASSPVTVSTRLARSCRDVKEVLPMATDVSMATGSKRKKIDRSEKNSCFLISTWVAGDDPGRD